MFVAKKDFFGESECLSCPSRFDQLNKIEVIVSQAERIGAERIGCAEISPGHNKYYFYYDNTFICKDHLHGAAGGESPLLSSQTKQELEVSCLFRFARLRF